MRNGSFAVGEKIPEDVFVSSTYANYSRKALFSKDLKKHTEWIYLELDNFDANYTCASDGTKIIYLDAQLNPATDLPQFEGRGLMLADGSLLRGKINGQLTVADRQGNILVRDEKLTLLGNGVTARSVTRYPHDYTTVMYPVLDGLEDVWIEDQLNRFIREQAESYVSFDGTYAEEDHYFFPITDIQCSVNIIKNLLHIELSVDEYWIGAAHPGYDWSNEYISLIDGRRYAIDDLFKSPDEARQRLCEKVNDQIAELAEEFYDFYDKVVPEQIQRFHLEDDGLTIYFAQYEIAPYAAGMPMFHIPYSEIMDLIDTEGNFWKAFNQSR
ncbi:MAG TPA: RsiV family protein [Thermoclostridium caenicola]|uniref:RsiV family protein n=1 Tax=Thermoclostridium caenicola TaxID=659425 RepID=UPI002C05568B|nr:RsiV family protein [Thermoclostridium caenicola]HPO77056.1 RsiV family protein [Thermoclostridium caenicola]